MKILLIEDDPRIADTVIRALKRARMTYEHASTGEEGVELALLYPYSVIVLDLGLPDIEGHEVLRRLRDRSNTTPVLILSGRNDVDNKLRGLDSGADDYMIKPFSRDEMISRINAIVRRAAGASAQHLTVGPVVLDLSTREVYVNGEHVPLSRREFEITELMMLRAGATLSKEAFLNHVYTGLECPDPKIIDVFVCKIRKKLAAANDGDHLIHTVWGRGYKMSVETQ